MKTLMISTIISAMVLTGCKKNEAETPTPATPQASSETQTKPKAEPKAKKTGPIGPTIIATGNEPGWHFTIKGTQAIYKSPEVLDGITIDVERKMSAQSIQYKGLLSGEEFVLAITRTKCEDSMSGQKFPLTASLLRSDGTYGGCARRQ